MISLYHGDCLEVLPGIPDGSIDAVIADPPYGTTACKWDSIIPLDRMWIELKRIIKPRGAIVLFAGQPFTSALIMSNPGMYRYVWVWLKSRVTGFLNAKRQPLRAHDDIAVFYANACTYNPQYTTRTPYTIKRAHQTASYGAQRAHIGHSSGQRYPTTLINIPAQREGLHPTQKPVPLLEYLIKTYTNPGETVLDFCMGSGTTGVAAVNTGRGFIGIEKERQYYDIAEQRIRDAGGSV